MSDERKALMDDDVEVDRFRVQLMASGVARSAVIIIRAAWALWIIELSG